MMQISKIDQFDVKLARPRELNPLNSIEITFDLLFRNDSITLDSVGALKIHEKEIN